MIKSQDFQYIGLQRIVGDDANIPTFRGTINGTLFIFNTISRSTVEMKKANEDKITLTGFNREKLIEVTGFKEPHEEIIPPPD